MGDSSADIEALLVDLTDSGDPTPGTLPAIFRDIVGRLDARRCAYAVVGRIALAYHEQPRSVRKIKIVADLGTDGTEQAAELAHATQAQFTLHMDPRRCVRPIGPTILPCVCETEERLLSEATTQPWFGVPARLASAEHVLWLWCRLHASAHSADAAALIAGGTVDLYRVQALLRETDDGDESGQKRLRLAIGDAVFSTTFSFSRFMAERRAQLNPNCVRDRRTASERSEGTTAAQLTAGWTDHPHHGIGRKARVRDWLNLLNLEPLARLVIATCGLLGAVRPVARPRGTDGVHRTIHRALSINEKTSNAPREARTLSRPEVSKIVMLRD